jgi:ribonuclease P protein component
MLSKKVRLTPNNFYRNLAKSKKANGIFISIAVKSAPNTFPRFAIIVPAVLDKRSVYRHRTKRIIIEAIQSQFKNFPSGIDVLVRAKKILKKEERRKVKEEIERLLKETDLLKSQIPSTKFQILSKFK